MRFRKLKSLLKETHYRKLLDFRTALKNLYKTRKFDSKRFNWDELRAAKRSEELFIICSGPSLNDITDAQWDHIAERDSLGINFSYLIQKPITYHIFSFEKDKLVTEAFKKTIKKYLALNESTILIPLKAVARLAHPRLYPELFPDKPKYLLFELPKLLSLERNRDFIDKDFDKSLFYRGTTSLGIELGVNVLEYNKIIIVGSDQHTIGHFYDGYPEMQNLNKRRKERHVNRVEIGTRKYTGQMGTMVPKGNKYHTYDVYLRSLRDYLIRKRGIELYVDFHDDLYPDIPAYFE